MPRLLPAMALLVPLAIALIVAIDDNEVTNPEQRLFLQALEEGREQYDDAPNEITKDEVEAARDQKLCDSSLASAEGWVGEIGDLSTGFGGLELEIRIGDQIDLRTGNIREDDPVFEMARELQEGDTVTFDGIFELTGNKCLNPQSLFQESRMTSPDFDFEITSLTKA
ncbi:hypothetical protein [Blastococcus sp. SYSU DS1024]